MSEKETYTSFTNREKYLISSFKIDEITMNVISEIGRMLGTHKYDVWIAKEAKRNRKILGNFKTIQYIVDWANKNRPNITKLSFEEAEKLSVEWHKKFEVNINESNVNNTANNAEDERIIYKCKDKKSFFIILRPEDLKGEGEMMGSCVGSYIDKVRSGKSIIVSLRDIKNQPHVTIEIDVHTGTTTQVRGKNNSDTLGKYQKMIVEFAICVSGYKDELDDELIELINMKFEK